MDIEGNAGHVVIPKRSVAVLKNKMRCDQYYQHISNAMDDSATYWHKFNARYAESDPACYNKKTGEIISPLCYNVREAAEALLRDLWFNGTLADILS